MGWRLTLRRGAKLQPLLLILDDVWDGYVVKAFTGISPNIRILVTTRKLSLYDPQREVVLKPNDGVWADPAVNLRLLAKRALDQDQLPAHLQVSHDVCTSYAISR